MATLVLFLIHLIGNFAIEQVKKKEVIMKKAKNSKQFIPINDKFWKSLNPILNTTNSWAKAIGATVFGNVL